MKKLLVLALVLSMASMANATLTISALTPASVVEGGTATIDITTNAVIPDLGGTYWALVCDTSLGNIDYTTGTVAAGVTDGGIVIEHGDTAVNIGYPLAAGLDGVSGADQPNGGTGILANTLLYTGFVLTAGNTAGPLTVSLFESYDGGATLVLSDSKVLTVTAPAVPEPFTMGLLGLGGLFLRRRSK